MANGTEPSFPPWLLGHLRALVRLALTQQLPSGLLVTGPEGVGKGLLVRTFMQRIACTQAGANELPCGACNGCHSVLSGAHPEILDVTPEEPGKEILIDAIRAVSDFLSLSHSGPARVVFIEPAELMTMNAANALLRTLEEPPGGAMIVLSAAGPARLPATIRSRCRLLRVARPQPDVVRDWLPRSSDRAMSVDEALAASMNRPLDALELLRDTGAIETWQQDHETLRTLLEQDSPFPVIARFRDSNLKSLTPRLQCLLLSAQYYLATGQHDGFGRLFERSALEGYASRHGRADLARLSAEALRWQREAEAPLNPELRCEAMVLRLMGPGSPGLRQAARNLTGSPMT